MLLFPLSYPINPLTLNFGGIATNICTWSGQTSASIISTSFHSHKLLRIVPISSRFCPKNLFFYTLVQIQFDICNSSRMC